jgi:hypothetical protein
MHVLSAVRPTHEILRVRHDWDRNGRCTVRRLRSPAAEPLTSTAHCEVSLHVMLTFRTAFQLISTAAPLGILCSNFHRNPPSAGCLWAQFTMARCTQSQLHDSSHAENGKVPPSSLVDSAPQTPATQILHHGAKPSASIVPASPGTRAYCISLCEVSTAEA